MSVGPYFNKNTELVSNTSKPFHTVLVFTNQQTHICWAKSELPWIVIETKIALLQARSNKCTLVPWLVRNVINSTIIPGKGDQQAVQVIVEFIEFWPTDNLTEIIIYYTSSQRCKCSVLYSGNIFFCNYPNPMTDINQNLAELKCRILKTLPSQLINSTTSIMITTREL